MNRLTQSSFDDGSQLTYTYDTGTGHRGRLVQVTDPQGSTSWSYDSPGRITERRQHLDGIDLTLHYGYDAQGRLTEITYPSGRIIALGYDASGRTLSLKADGQSLVNAITYHPFGLPTGWTWGNGTPHNRSFDLDGRITGYPLGTVNHTLSYDPASRITGITGSSTKTYGYDALDRLTSVTAPGLNQTYGYDPNGNRLIETLGAQTTSYSYALGSNRLQSRTQGTIQSYTYDAAGNRTDDGAHTYTYDARGRMVQATTGALTTTYRYNGLGQRVSKTAPGSSAISRRFVYDEAGHLIGEYDGAGAPIQETVYLADMPIAVLSGTDGIHFVHADQINTPRAIADTQGAVWRWESDPFGGRLPDQDPDGDGLGFVYNLRMPRQYFDSETGLHYNYFRDYDPRAGRYIQSDPIGLAGGSNTYAYVRDNPLQLIDSHGLNATTLPGFSPIPSPAAHPVFQPGTSANNAFVDSAMRLLDRAGQLTAGDNVIDLDKEREKRKETEGDEACPAPNSGGGSNCTFTGLAGIVPASNGYGFYLQCQYRCPRKGLRIDISYIGIKSDNPAFLCPRTLPESWFP